MQVRAAVTLVLGAVPGIVLGVLVLTNVPAIYATIPLGLLLILFGLYSLFQPQLPEKKPATGAQPERFNSGNCG